MQRYIVKKGFGFLLLISLFGLSGCGGEKVSSDSNVAHESTDNNTTETSTNDNVDTSNDNNHTTIDGSITTTETGHTDEVNNTTATSTNDTVDTSNDNNHTTTETGHTDEVNSTTETSTNDNTDAANDHSIDLVLTKEQRLVADQFVSVFENSTTAFQYGYAKNICDGRGITAGRAGFTSATGDMMILIKDYLKIKPDAKLKKYLSELARLNELRYGEKKDKEASASTKNLRGLVGDWKEASKDEQFRKLQDEVVDKLYYYPALKYAKELGLTYPLGVLVLYDANIVHGEDGKYGLKKLISQTNESFDGKSPKKGIDEMEWLKKFNEIRKENYKKEGRDDDARINELLEMIETGKYDLEPFDMKVNQWGDEEFKLGTPNIDNSKEDYVEDDADYLCPIEYDDEDEKVIFVDDFEDNFNTDSWEVTCYTNGDLRCDKDPYNENGELNIKALQSYGGKKHERKEVITQKEPYALLYLNEKNKYQIDIRLRLPTDRKPDVYETGGEILFQLHATDEGIDSPPLALVVYGDYYYWYARNFNDAAQEKNARNNSIYNPTDKDEIEALFKQGKVYKIDELKAEHGNAIHFHITMQKYKEDAGNGKISRRIKVEKEGKEMNILFERNKSSRLAKIANIKFKGPQLGIYKWDWDTDTYEGNITKRTVYYDNIKVTEASKQ